MRTIQGAVIVRNHAEPCTRIVKPVSLDDVGREDLDKRLIVEQSGSN